MDAMGIYKPPRGCQLNRTHPLARGLVGAWLMNEGTGDTVWDYSGNQNTGTLMNMDPATDWVATQHGEALDFDGSTNQYAIIDGSNPLFSSTDFSFNLLVHFDGLAGDDGDLIQKAARHNSGEPLVMWFDTGNALQFLLTDGGSTYSGVKISATSTVSAGWYDITLVFRGSINTRLYFDGCEDGSSPFDTSALSELDTTDDITLAINTNLGSYDGKRLNGQIAHFFWWNRALSAVDVREMHRAPYAMFAPRTSPGVFYVAGGTSYKDFTASLSATGGGSADGLILAPVAAALSALGGGNAAGTIIAEMAATLAGVGGGSAGGSVLVRVPAGGLSAVGGGNAEGSVLMELSTVLTALGGGNADGLVIAPLSASASAAGGGNAVGTIAAQLAAAISAAGTGVAGGSVVVPLSSILSAVGGGSAAGRVYPAGGSVVVPMPLFMSGQVRYL